MKQYFDEIKQRYPKTAKALGITADMDYEEWREAYLYKPLRTYVQPVDISGLRDPTPPTWLRWYSNSTVYLPTKGVTHT